MQAGRTDRQHLLAYPSHNGRGEDCATFWRFPPVGCSGPFTGHVTLADARTLWVAKSISGGYDREVAALDQRHRLDIQLAHDLPGGFSLASYDQIASLQPPASNSRNECSAQSRHAPYRGVPGFGRCSSGLHDSHDRETDPRHAWASSAPGCASGERALKSSRRHPVIDAC